VARKIEVELVGDSSSLERAFGRAQSSGGKFGGTFSKLGKLAAAGFAAAGVAAAVGAKKSIDAASDLNESINALNVTFGKASERLLKFGENASTTVGLSQRAFNQLATPVGAMLQNMGLSADKAAGQTINLTKRAADMASVFNTDVDEAMQAIQAGLRGESDPLERFGVGLSETAINAFAVKKGIAAVGEELTPQQKTMARLGLLYKQTSKFQGDFANTSDGLANQQRILGARFEDLQAKIGQKLLPIGVKLAEWAMQFIDWSERNWPKFSAAIDNAIEAVRPHFERLVAYWNGTLLPAIQGVVNRARQFWNRFGGDITRVFNTAKAIVTNSMLALKAAIEVVMAVIRGDWSTAWNRLKEVVARVLGGVKQLLIDLPGKLIGLAANIGQALVSGILNGLAGLADALFSKISGAIGDAFDRVKGVFGIHSPSKWTAEQIGAPLAEGIAVGFGNAARRIGSGMAMPALAAAGGGRRAAVATAGGPRGDVRVIVVGGDAQAISYFTGLNARHARGNGGRSLW
jgi:phage-related protein